MIEKNEHTHILTTIASSSFYTNKDKNIIIV